MGEVIQNIDSRIKITDQQAILEEALKLMIYEDELGNGHSSIGPNHFSWLNRAEPETWETGFDALRDWRFPVRDEEENVWTEFVFQGEKVGQEFIFFKRIKPYVEGYVEYSTDYGRTHGFYFSK